MTQGVLAAMLTLLFLQQFCFVNELLRIESFIHSVMKYAHGLLIQFRINFNSIRLTAMFVYLRCFISFYSPIIVWKLLNFGGAGKFIKSTLTIFSNQTYGDQFAEKCV
jgi:hypothetical protein